MCLAVSIYSTSAQHVVGCSDSYCPRHIKSKWIACQELSLDTCTHILFVILCFWRHIRWMPALLFGAPLSPVRTSFISEIYQNIVMIISFYGPRHVVYVDIIFVCPFSVAKCWKKSCLQEKPFNFVCGVNVPGHVRLIVAGNASALRPFATYKLTGQQSDYNFACRAWFPFTPRSVRTEILPTSHTSLKSCIFPMRLSPPCLTSTTTSTIAAATHTFRSALFFFLVPCRARSVAAHSLRPGRPTLWCVKQIAEQIIYIDSFNPT